MMILEGILGLILLLIPAGLLYLWDRKQLRSLGLATVRMVAQTAVLCLMVWALLRYDQAWLSMLWVVVMAVYASAVVLWRTKCNVLRFLLPMSVAQMIATLGVGCYLLLAVLPVEHGMEARWLVPVMALLLGHSTICQIRGMNTYISALQADESQYEFLRGNGKDHLQAVMPFVRRSFQAVMAPVTNQMAQISLFTMPLLLGGLLMAGMAPQSAFVVMIAMAAGCVASSAVALVLSLIFCDSKLFDKFGKIALLLAMLTMISCVGQEEKRYEMPARMVDRPEQILVRKGYVVSYNQETKTPNWVAWHLTKGHTSGIHQRKKASFEEDTEVSSPRANNNDYFNSRWDRGHMCPAGDNKWDGRAMEQTFLFTNICPQNHKLNNSEWNDLEILCRKWAKKYGSIEIVCGPIYEGEHPQTIGRSKIWVPNAFFKVVLCRQKDHKSIGFIFMNNGKNQSMEGAVRTVDQIEKLTGIDFFPELDDRIELKVEAKAKLEDW